MGLTAGTRLGPYEIVATLGAGGMGEVYRAHDTRLNREVALKVLPTAVSCDPDRLRRFEQEARAAAALNHPNILAVFDFGFAGDTPYVISELLEGETLRQRIASAGLPIRKAVDYALQTAQGLAAAHQKSIVHRDIKPENLFITHDGRVKILDFGLAKLMGAPLQAGDATSIPTEELATGPGLVLGTAGYMSPEQVRGKPVDHRSDIFSLGAVLYEMITARRAFLGESSVEAMNAILHQEPVEFAGTGVQVPPALDHIVRHCLEKSPDERFQSARDLAFALERLSTNSAPAAQPPPAVQKTARRAPVGIIAACLACVAAGALVGRTFWRTTDPPAAQFRYSELATESAIQTEPAWSPDASTIAYATVVNGVSQIATRSLPSSARALVTRSDQDCHFPFWAADGGRIYYLRGDPGGAIELWAVGAAGGAAERIIPDVLSAALLPDGRTFVFVRASKEGLVLYRQSPPEPPVAFPNSPLEGSKYRSSYLRLSPDGRELGMFAATGEGTFHFWLIPLPAGAARNVLTTRNYSRGTSSPLPFDWMPDSRRILYSGSASGRAENHLVLADTRTGSLSPVTGGWGQEIAPAISPDGARIAFGAPRTSMDIWEMPLDGSPPRQMLATSQAEHCAAWAPSGDRFVYSREVGGADQIWLYNVREGASTPVISAAAFRDGADRVTEAEFSPDGTRISFARVQRGATTAWVVSAAGGPPVALVRDGGQQLFPSWSPDGNWIAYYTFTGLAKVSTGGSGSPVLLRSTPAGYRPRWSPRGDWLTLVEASGLSIISADGATSRRLSSVGGWNDVGFTRDGTRVAGVRFGADRHLLLVSIELASGKETVLADINRTLPDATDIHGVSMAPDGKSFLTSVGRFTQDIWLLDGFRP